MDSPCRPWWNPQVHLPPARVQLVAAPTRRWLAGLAAVVSMPAAMCLDGAVQRFAAAHPRVGDLPPFDLLRSFAELPVAASISFAVCALDRRGGLIVAHTLFAMYLGFNVMSAGKCLLERDRPYRAARSGDPASGAGTGWRGLDPSLRRSAGRSSFPSGHTTNAFAMAGTLAWFYPRLRWPLWAAAGGCAASRALQQWHWFSDCVAGMWIGCGAAWLSLRGRALTQPSRWRRRARSAPR